MTEEIYKNGDIYYIKTLLGEIKMFDKDGNEINWTPTQNLGDKLIFYNQAYINEQTKRLEQENKTNEKQIELDVEHICRLNEQIEKLEQENKELKLQRDEVRIAYNNLILDIISDIPFTGEIGSERNISIKDHLHQIQKALASLEEIRKMVTSPYPGKPRDVLKIINEVLE